MASSANIRDQKVLCVSMRRERPIHTRDSERQKAEGEKTHEILSQRRTLMGCNFPQQQGAQEETPALSVRLSLSTTHNTRPLAGEPGCWSTWGHATRPQDGGQRCA